MKDFDLRKYLAENRLLKEEVSQFLIDSFIEGVKDAFGEESNLYATEGDEYEKLKTAAEEVISSTDSGDTTVEELIYASQLYALGLAENKLLKEEIDFPEMEDEFKGYQDAMLGSDLDFFKGVIDATPEELLDIDGGYYEVAIGVEQGRYSAEEAVKLAKAWAKDKLSGLAKAMEIEKARVEKTIRAFDKENYDYRYKSYDVNDHEGEIFVVYKTQSDFEQIRGKEMLLDLLSNFQYPIYVHYTVRDNYNPDNHDLYTKKGFELA